MSGVDPFFDHINAGVIRVTRDVVVLQWNRFMVTATGRRAEDVVGQSLLECFPRFRSVGSGGSSGPYSSSASTPSPRGVNAPT